MRTLSNEIFSYIGEVSIKYNTTHITDCCQRKRTYAGKLLNETKLVWMYYEDYIKQQNNKEDF